MTRRTFLRVLGSAAIGAGIMQMIPSPVARAIEAGPTWDQGTAGPLTYEMLERAYKACALGSREPNLMIMSSSTARRLGLVYDVEFEQAA